MKSKAAKGEPEDPLETAILEAVLHTVAQEGFEGASIRRVATRSGYSAGAIQKRFATRQHLLRAAYERVVAAAVERMEWAQADITDSLVGRQMAAALQTLPLDAVRRREGLVWTAYLLRAAIDDSLSDLPRSLDHAVGVTLTAELCEAAETGRLRSDADPRALADAVVAMVDGIAIRMLYSPQDEQESLLAALDVGLRALLPD